MAAETRLSGRFIAGWGAAWAVVGLLVAGGVVLLQPVDFGPLLALSVLFAEVVGFTAFTSVRLIFPLFGRLPYLVRLAFEVLTLFGGTVFGSAIVFAFFTLYVVARPRTALLIVAVNALIAVMVGISLHTYDSMRRQIEGSYRALREKESLDRELNIARDVQRELLPRAAPLIAGIELAGVCIPAAGVGGDYYDFLPLADDQVGLVIADVSGKGVPAALLMAGLQASVRSLTRPLSAPAELTRRLNEVLCASCSAARYATCFLGVYDGATRTLCYSNAGHLPPLVVNDGPVERLSAGGLPIGMFDASRYREARHSLKPGDLLTLYTDGVVETTNPQGEEFGERRLLELLQRCRRDALGEIQGQILAALESWGAGAGPHDDVTLVLARVR
ncbi:MAG TPA: PP2C family protein-serine/threonine phosphatase [Candidatus Polarisedimenticolaceae bacterium]|nr:PP2C family protein-serine/threonine phosphatase [Candidatus Polarisedimenticolaceae bacterium]